MHIELGRMPNLKTCLITGASGYVGSHIANCLERHGWSIIEAQRKPSLNPSRQWIYWDMTQKNSLSLVGSVDVLIHCAWDFSTTTPDLDKNANVISSIKLFKDAKNIDIKKNIFLSTLSSFDGCRSIYGQAKYFVEKQVELNGGSIIRPGLVYGSNPGGMYGALKKLVLALPVIPLIDGGRQRFFLCHQDDLCNLILALVEMNPEYSIGPIIAANDSPITLKKLLKEIALRNKKYRNFIPVPSILIFIILRIFEGLGIRIRFKSDSLVSLLNLPENVNFQYRNMIYENFRSFKV